MSFDAMTLALAKSQIEIATDEDTMYVLAEMGLIIPITNSNSEIFISSSNEIYCL